MKQVWIAALAGALLLAGCDSGGSTASKDSTTTTTTGSTGSSGAAGGSAAGGEKTIAFVTNGTSDFWTIAKKGTDKAQAELKGFKIQFVEPSETAAALQKAKMDDLMSNGVKGVAISPIDPENGKADLNNYASKAVLITTDSDAPDTNRICYIGTDNVLAGKAAGETIKKALPNGGKIMVFVGKKDVLNAKERYEGIQQELKGSNVSIIDIRTDDADHARAKQNVSDAIVANPDLACCVGLWSYNGPAIVAAVKEAHKEGKIKVVCFDEEQGTLDGIRDGTVFGTIVQNPFEFGYQSMKMVADLVDGKKPAIPADKRIIIPVRVIDKSNIEPFDTDLKAKLGK